MADVRLVDLEVIKRFSLAVRQDTASAEEVLDALDASRRVVLAALGRTPAPPAAVRRAPRATTAKAPKPAARATKRGAAAKTAAAKTAAAKSAAGKSAAGTSAAPPAKNPPPTARSRRRPGGAGSE